MSDKCHKCKLQGSLTNYMNLLFRTKFQYKIAMLNLSKCIQNTCPVVACNMPNSSFSYKFCLVLSLQWLEFYASFKRSYQDFFLKKHSFRNTTFGSFGIALII